MTTCGKNIGQRLEKSLSSRTALKLERVSNRQPTVDDLPVLQILCVQGGAVGPQRGGENQRIVNSHVVPFRNDQSVFVSVHGDRDRIGAEELKYPEGLPYVVPGHTNLAAGDIGKLVQNLHADDPTLRQQLLGPASARILRTQTVNQNVSIEERPTAHRCRRGRRQIPRAGGVAAFADAPRLVSGCGRGSLQRLSPRRLESRCRRLLSVQA